MRIRQVFAHYEPGPQPASDYKFCPFCGAQLTPRDVGGRLRPACQSCRFVQFSNPAPSVSIVVVAGDRVLLGRRRSEPGQGTWSVPSGYVEFDDDFLSAAIREVREETGLTVRPVRILNVVSSFVSPRFHYLGLYLEAHVTGGELAANDDLAEVAWFPVTGPLPELGFLEDRLAIEMVAAGVDGLPVETGNAEPFGTGGSALSAG